VDLRINMPSEAFLAQAIAHTGIPLVGASSDFDVLLERIGDARFVFLGEATHGTHEFYRLRAELTKRLIREKGFLAIAAEADWPDAYRVNRYIRGAGSDVEAIDALAGFKRFPPWMWLNADILDLVGWLRTENDHVRDQARKVGFYGLDVYSLHASIQAVLAYLDRKDPDAARRAHKRYECFAEFGADPQRYGRATALGLTEGCEQEVIDQLVELQRRRAGLLQKDGILAEDEHFEAEQNAQVVAHAEQYYRAMHLGDVSTWNLRDTHMADTLDALAEHLSRHGRPVKIVVWAHNSHVGDSAATQRDSLGEINIGHLSRQRHRRDTVLVGFSTYHGTVTAAADWDAPAERKHVRPALKGSYEALFHHSGVRNFLLLLDSLGEAAGALHEARLQRAIGVVYRPRSERASHYYYVRLPDQFDALIHLDETRALEPLERTAEWERGELPETYPSGL
jgi:erythromycin esterase-like protein